MKTRTNAKSYSKAGLEPDFDDLVRDTLAKPEPEQDQIVQVALAILEYRYRPGAFLESPAEVKDYLRLELSDRKFEAFGCIFLDCRHRVIEIAELFAGSIDSASVHPRVVVERALHLNAARVIFYHCHPSGCPKPSSADRAITQKLVDALMLIEVRVLDHLVIGATEVSSFAELGYV